MRRMRWRCDRSMFPPPSSVEAAPHRWRTTGRAVALTLAVLGGLAQADDQMERAPAQETKAAASEEAKSARSEDAKPVASQEAKAAAPGEQTERTAIEEKKRAVPDYEGRGPEPTSFGDVALWVPRIIALPFYLVTEYVITQPLGALVTAAEEHHWPTFLIDFFTFGEDHEAGLIP